MSSFVACRRLGRLSALALTLVFALVGCQKQSPPAGASSSPTKITVAQWGTEKYLIYLPLYVAMEEGYFRDQGLDVSLIYTGNDDQTFAAVVSGSAQFGVGDPAFAAISNEKGLPARVIATLVGGVAIWGVTNNDKVPVIQKPADLAGLRVGTFPSPSTNYTLVRALIDANPDLLKQTKIVEADIGAQLALLESHSADVAMVLEPAASKAEIEGYRLVYSSPKFHGPFTFTGITATQDYLATHQDVTQRFVNALQRALTVSHKDVSVAVRVGQKLFPTLDKTVVEHAVNRMLSEETYPKSAAVSAEAWNSVLEVRKRVGDLKAMQPLATSVDNSFADKALTAAKP